MPGLKPTKPTGKPAPPQQPRQSRPHGFARMRMTPTQRVEHALERCPDCGTQLSGGWIHRTREVIDVPVVPAEVTEHVYIARTCSGCRRRCIPAAQLDGVVLGKQRLGINLVSLIATLREEARLPIVVVQGYLRTVHGLHVSKGAIGCGTSHRPAGPGCGGPDPGPNPRQSVVHADETSWREDGHNGYVWTFSTPSQRYCPCSSQGQALRRNRSKGGGG